MKQYSIIVNSCDKYEAAWTPFFELLNIYWSRLEAKVYLNTETKNFCCDDLPVTTLNSLTKSWGKRLATALGKIESPYVVCFLEDFFLQKKVNVFELEKCVEFMESDPSIAVFYFNRITGYTDESNDYSKYYRMEINEKNRGEYFLNCQAAIWRKDVLAALAEKCDNPWMFEIEGYKFVSELGANYKFFCSKTTKYDSIKEDDVFAYLVDRGTGFGIWRGKWLWNNRKLFAKHNISCDFTTLATLEYYQYMGLCVAEMVKKPLRKIRKKIRGEK